MTGWTVAAKTPSFVQMIDREGNVVMTVFPDGSVDYGRPVTGEELLELLVDGLRAWAGWSQ